MSSIKPLDQTDVLHILELEKLFHSRYLTTELLNELISLYVTIVDSFGESTAYMRVYFLEKLRFLLSRPQIEKLLEPTADQPEQKQVVPTQFRQTIHLVDMPDMHAIESLNTELRKRNQLDLESSGNQETRKKQRSHKIQMQMKLLRQVQENMRHINNDIKQVKQLEGKKEQQISAELKKQDMNFEERLAKRRKKKNKKLRNSFHQKQQDEEQQPPIAKQELVKAQEQISMAVIRMTERLTRRTLLANSLDSSDKTKEKVVTEEIKEADEEENDPEKNESNQKRVTERVGQLIEHDTNDKGRVTEREHVPEQSENMEDYF